MATEINCSCEITENEVTICYPPISSGGGGGIGGGGTLNRYAKFTPDGANIGDALIYEDGAGVWGDIGFSGGVGTQLSLGYSASGILTIDGTNYGALNIGADTVTLQTVTGGTNVISRFQINNNDILVKSPNISNGTYAYFEDDGNGNFTMRSAAPPSGGITGVAPVGNVPKVATVDTGDVILTLEESSIDDLAAGLSIAKSAAGGQYINLVVDNTDDDIEVQLNLISNNTTTVYQANFYLTDPNTLLTAGLTQDLDFLRWGYDTNGVDDIKVVIDKASKELQVLSGGEAYFNIDLTNGIYWLGDHAAVNHGTQIEVDDATELITLRASHGIETSMYSVGGVAGIDGTFEDANGLIVTVTKGIITSIV